MVETEAPAEVVHLTVAERAAHRKAAQARRETAGAGSSRGRLRPRQEPAVLRSR
jgi:hypothetical protein